MEAHSNSTPERKARPIQIGGRTVAVLRGQTLDVRRKSSGILQRPPGIAMARDLLNEAQSLGCQQIHVTVTDTGTEYFVTLTDFLEKSWPIQRGGFEPQRVAPLGAFECLTDMHSDVTAVLRKFEPRQNVGTLQMGLF